MTSRDFVVVDAFTDQPGAGNPATVMVLDQFLDDTALVRLAAEHNYAETAFLVKKAAGHYDLRWFTPAMEVPLCGHGTLASAHALYTEHGEEAEALTFDTRSGALRVTRDEGRYRLDLPADTPRDVPLDPAVGEALAAEPVALVRGKFLIAVFDDENTVRSLTPNMSAVAAIDADEVVATAAAQDTDFVSRMFGPKIGIPEDPFTGATHTLLAPYWAERLGKTTLTAHQASSRGGDAVCELAGDRVFLLGNAVTTMRGQILF